jgi:hypothetical protein
MKPFWTNTEGENLAQGDFLPGCHVPAFGEAFGIEGAEQEIARESDLIIVTQSCDLQNDKVALVALCPVHTLDVFEQSNPNFKTRNRWEAVRKGQQPGLHLLASPETPEDNRAALVVDFGEIHSLPPSYVKRHAAKMGSRWRLESPFLEHFSQGVLGSDALRRDQIWFTEKDKSGASHLYPLTDFHPRREENLERGYLQGRYGAVPFLGDLVCSGSDE